MQRSSCHCSFSDLQRIAACLGEGILPLDNVLQLGAELQGHLHKIIKCERCVTSKRAATILSQLIPRLISFYEAAHLTVATADWARPGPTSTQLPGESGRGVPSVQSVSCEMRLGRLPIDSSEARMLVEVVLVDASLDLNGQMQEWKVAVDGSMELVQGGREPVVAVIGLCCDRLAKLIGLLQFGGLASAQL
nr:hypothetical protein [Chaetomium cochliodes]